MVRLTNEQPKEQPEQPDRPAEKPAAHRRRRWWKAPLLLTFAAIFFASGWFTYKVAAATGKIFTENTTGGSPVLKGKKLKDEQRVNLLLMGIGGEGHDGPNLTDTMQLASVDAKNKQVVMLSLPRDLYVQVPNSSQKVKLNEIHAIGEDQGTRGGGPGLLKDTVSDILGVPIHYFVRIDFAGFQQGVDAVGGIDVTVKERLYDPYYPRGTGYQVLDIRPGVQHLSGDLALKYARSRETTSDFDRSRRQQEVMVAVRDKALSLQYLTNPAKVAEFLQILGDHVKTDLSLGETQRFADIIKDIPPSAISSNVLDNSNYLYDSTGPGGAYILLPRAGDYSDIREFTAQLINGPTIRAEAGRIELQNASGREGLAKFESDALTGYGYSIVATTNAPQVGPTTVIYDFTGGKKPQTIAYLEKRFGVKAVKQTAADPNIEIRVVIGTDYTAREVTQPAYGGDL